MLDWLLVTSGFTSSRPCATWPIPSGLKPIQKEAVGWKSKKTMSAWGRRQIRNFEATGLVIMVTKNGFSDWKAKQPRTKHSVSATAPKPLWL